MSRRLLLHEELCTLLGSRKVYFQPPESLKLEYPCIVYSRSDVPIFHADNTNYTHTTQYQVIVIDKNPDSEIVEKMKYFPNTRFDRHYVEANLNYDAFTTHY